MGTDTKVPGLGAGVMQAEGSRAETNTERETPKSNETSNSGNTRGIRAKISDETWEKATRDYLGGETARVVAERHGMAPSTLYLRMAQYGKRAARSAEKRALLVETGLAPPPPDIKDLVLAIVGAMDHMIEKVIDASGMREHARRRIDGRPSRRVHHTKEMWAAARREYEDGHVMGVIAERYGMNEETMRARAHAERWCKRVSRLPDPLTLPDDPKQMDADGKTKWSEIAAEAQRAPVGAWSTWLFQGGRGAGKTRAGAEWLAARAEACPHGRFALVGPTRYDVREVMIEGPSGLRRLPGRETPQYESSRQRLVWGNGAIAYMFSAEEPERLRGPQFDAAWADEFCAWPKPSETLALLRMGLRRGADPRLVVTTTPRPIAALRKLRAESSCVATQAATMVNAENLSPSFLEGLEALYGGTRLARQELGGELLDGEGALWTRDMLASARGARPETFERVIVAVDPPGGAVGSVCGIVVAGLADGRAYVLEDASCAGERPDGWAQRVARAVSEHGAWRVIAERNMGGEMVRSTLRAAGVKCTVNLVTASEGKQARAQPVSALYERGRVTHCGTFALLEQEMMTIEVEISMHFMIPL